MANKKETTVVEKPAAEKKVEVKKSEPKADAKKKEIRKQPNAVVRFFRETVGELRKVNWPTRQEAIRLTGIVLVVLVVMSILLGGIDYLAGLLLNTIIGL